MRAVSVVLIGFFIVLSLGAFSEPQIITDLKNGDKQLECMFHDGWRTVDNTKIVGIDDMSGAWIFTNGYSSNCSVH